MKSHFMNITNLLLFPFTDMPVVTLKMGSSLNPDDIKEGADVYFECLIQSNPKPYKMSWYHNVSWTVDNTKRAFDLNTILTLYSDEVFINFSSTLCKWI